MAASVSAPAAFPARGSADPGTTRVDINDYCSYYQTVSTAIRVGSSHAVGALQVRYAGV